MIQRRAREGSTSSIASARTDSECKKTGAGGGGANFFGSGFWVEMAGSSAIVMHASSPFR